MSVPSTVETIVLEIPISLRVTVAVPQALSGNARAEAASLAAEAARSFTHVSAARLNAFNEVNRLQHPAQHGEVVMVESVGPDGDAV